MASQPQQPKQQDGVPPLLDILTDMLNMGKEASSMTPVPAIFRSVAILLTTIWVSTLLFRDGTFRANT